MTDDIDRKLRALTVAFGAALLIALAGTTAGWLLTQHESSSRTSAVREESRKREAAIQRESRQRVRALQANRFAVLVGNCLASNDSNRRTIRKLNEVARAYRPRKLTPRQAAQAQQSLQASKLIIGELAPYTDDCVAVAKKKLAAREPPTPRAAR